MAGPNLYSPVQSSAIRESTRCVVANNTLVARAIQIKKKTTPKSPPKVSEAYSDILRVLMIRLIRNERTVTSKELGARSGFSYPTIVSALLR